jgi:hypothetical protein
MPKTKTKTVDREDLLRIPVVPFTDTWAPWHHVDVSDIIDLEIIRAGLEKVPGSEQYQVSANGMDLFATVGVNYSDSANGQVMRRIGWRNSMQKNFALGLVAGMSIVVCSNMSFYGDYKETRVHRSNLDRAALEYFIQGALRSVKQDFSDQTEMLHTLATIQISEEKMKQIVFDLMSSGVINPSQFMKFLLALDEEKQAHNDLGGELTLNHIYGAVTRTLRGSSTRQIMDRTQKLENILISA